MKAVSMLSERVSSAHRLLGGWRDVLDDIRALCRAFDMLPDVCDCGHGEPHLVSECPCCGRTADVFVPACADCDARLAGLRPTIDVLAVDVLRFFPFVKEWMAKRSSETHRRLRDISAGISRLTASFESLVMAHGQFRANCRASHLKTLKSAAASLLRDAEQLNRLV
jgi:hypothetical protein